jgi:hypothetical protein
MTYEKESVHPKKEKISPGEFTVLGGIIAVVIAVFIGVALQQDKAGTEIDEQKDVYLFLHGRTDLHEKAVTALVTFGFSKEKIIEATSKKVGNAGDYMAMLWMPPNPDHIKIQLIISVDEIEPDKIIGLWNGVSREDIDTISLE